MDVSQSIADATRPLGDDCFLSSFLKNKGFLAPDPFFDTFWNLVNLSQHVFHQARKHMHSLSICTKLSTHKTGEKKNLLDSEQEKLDTRGERGLLIQLWVRDPPHPLNPLPMCPEGDFPSDSKQFRCWNLTLFNYNSLVLLLFIIAYAVTARILSLIHSGLAPSSRFALMFPTQFEFSLSPVPRSIQAFCFRFNFHKFSLNLHNVFIVPPLLLFFLSFPNKTLQLALQMASVSTPCLEFSYFFDTCPPSVKCK